MGLTRLNVCFVMALISSDFECSKIVGVFCQSLNKIQWIISEVSIIYVILEISKCFNLWWLWSHFNLSLKYMWYLCILKWWKQQKLAHRSHYNKKIFLSLIYYNKSVTSYTRIYNITFSPLNITIYTSYRKWLCKTESWNLK